MFLAILDGRLHQLGIFGFLGGGEDEGGVGGGILRLVLFDCCRMLAAILYPETEDILLKSPESQTTVYRAGQCLATNGGVKTYGAGGLELVERGSHDCCVLFRLISQVVYDGMGGQLRKTEGWLIGRCLEGFIQTQALTQL